ncbi:MAG: hypothetical protein CM15mP74_11070 [Halieaceae bacterium]|nr:MAG: hypothetical protein CM15mP74_11070 [Halieaceae bacterium]
MLLPKIEPVGKASAAGSSGLIGAKSLFSSSGGFEAQAARPKIASKQSNCAHHRISSLKILVQEPQHAIRCGNRFRIHFIGSLGFNHADHLRKPH